MAREDVFYTRHQTLLTRVVEEGASPRFRG